MKLNKKGVFGLNAVQQFFAIILGIALLAYVIVIVMGTLSEGMNLNQVAESVINESGWVNRSGYTLQKSTLVGFANPVITQLINTSSNKAIVLANASVTSAGVVTNASLIEWNAVKISYTYTYDSNYQNNLDTVLSNTSTGITGFFSSINPIYAILAVLVIILVLVVLVRVVQRPNESVSPQL